MVERMQQGLVALWAIHGHPAQEEGEIAGSISPCSRLVDYPVWPIVQQGVQFHLETRLGLNHVHFRGEPDIAFPGTHLPTQLQHIARPSAVVSSHVPDHEALCRRCLYHKYFLEFVESLVVTQVNVIKGSASCIAWSGRGSSQDG